MLIYVSTKTKEYAAGVFQVDNILLPLYAETASNYAVSTEANLDSTIKGYPNKLVIDCNVDPYLVREKNEEEYRKDFKETVLQQIRVERDKKLADSDKYMMEDYPLKTTKDAVRVYRKALREFPSIVDVDAVLWPVNPEE